MRDGPQVIPSASVVSSQKSRSRPRCPGAAPCQGDLTADELVAVERVADDEVAGVASEDAAVRGLEEFRQSLDRRLVDVDAFGVAGDERSQIGPANRCITTSPVAGLVKAIVPVAMDLKPALWGASNSLPCTSKAISIAWPVPQKSGSTSVPTSWKRLLLAGAERDRCRREREQHDASAARRDKAADPRTQERPPAPLAHRRDCGRERTETRHQGLLSPGCPHSPCPRSARQVVWIDIARAVSRGEGRRRPRASPGGASLVRRAFAPPGLCCSVGDVEGAGRGISDPWVVLVQYPVGEAHG